MSVSLEDISSIASQVADGANLGGLVLGPADEDCLVQEACCESGKSGSHATWTQPGTAPAGISDRECGGMDLPAALSRETGF